MLPLPKPRTEAADAHAGKDIATAGQRGPHGADGPSPKRLVSLAFSTAEKIRQVLQIRVLTWAQSHLLMVIPRNCKSELNAAGRRIALDRSQTRLKRLRTKSRDLSSGCRGVHVRAHPAPDRLRAVLRLPQHGAGG